MVIIKNPDIICFKNNSKCAAKNNWKVVYDDKLRVKFSYKNESSITDIDTSITDIDILIPTKIIFAKSDVDKISDYLKNERPMCAFDNEIERKIKLQIIDYLNDKDLKDIDKYIKVRGAKVAQKQNSLFFKCACAGSGRSNIYKID